MTFGKFSGNPITEWLSEDGDDRKMKIINNFSYCDPNEKYWHAPAGSIIDGASIPAGLWSTVGSPYTGDYRRASIVHDVACGIADIDRLEADEMFYFACQAGGCTKNQSQALYIGVRIGSWSKKIELWGSQAVNKPLIEKSITMQNLPDRSMKNTFDEISMELAKDSTLSFSEIQQIIERHLRAKNLQFNHI